MTDVLVVGSGPAGMMLAGELALAGIAATVDELMAMDEPRIRVAALIHGLDIAYDLGVGHPLLGRPVAAPRDRCGRAPDRGARAR